MSVARSAIPHVVPDVDRDPQILHRAHVGTAGAVVQHQALAFKRLFFDRPMLIFIERGEKLLRWPGGEQRYETRSAIAIPAGASLDVINCPDGTGLYQARFVVFDAALVQDHASRHRDQPIVRRPCAILQNANALQCAIAAAVSAIGDAALPERIAHHRAAELLLWIGLACGRFEEAVSPSAMVRVRRLIGSDLGADWRSDAIATQLAMSEPTLRRKLAAEGTSLSEIIADMRLSQGLALLQSTKQSVTEIAAEVGYATPSHFTARFQRRFGFAPSAVRSVSRGGASLTPPAISDRRAGSLRTPPGS